MHDNTLEQYTKTNSICICCEKTRKLTLNKTYNHIERNKINNKTVYQKLLNIVVICFQISK